MKDFRYEYRYNIDEWEDDDEWKAKRLAFIWDVRTHFPKHYLSSGLVEEKNDFYLINSEVVSKLASSDYYSIDSSYYENKFKNNIVKIALRFFELEQIKKNGSISEFLRKDIVNEYDYILCNYDYSELDNTYKEYMS